MRFLSLQTFAGRLLIVFGLDQNNIQYFYIRHPAKVKTDKIFMGNCFWRFLKNQDLSDKNFVINFLKSPLELHFTHVSDFCRMSNMKSLENSGGNGVQHNGKKMQTNNQCIQEKISQMILCNGLASLGQIKTLSNQKFDALSDAKRRRPRVPPVDELSLSRIFVA